MKKLLETLVHFFGTTLGHTLGTFLLGISLAQLKAWRDSVTLSEILTNWRELISPFFIAVLIVLLILLTRQIVRLHSENKNHRSTLGGIGLSLVSRHETQEEKAKDWNSIRQSLANLGQNGAIWVLGATGRETFGASTAPLCDVIRKSQSPIRVLLVRPYSKGFDRRVKELNTNADNYKSEILDAIDFCAEQKKNGKDIELKVYSEIAIWKMVITPRQLWLQHYSPMRHVDDTPIYCFESLENEIGLYSALKTVFHKRWALDGNPTIDLNQWTRSVGGDVKYWAGLTTKDT